MNCHANVCTIANELHSPIAKILHLLHTAKTSKEIFVFSYHIKNRLRYIHRETHAPHYTAVINLFADENFSFSAHINTLTTHTHTQASIWLRICNKNRIYCYTAILECSIFPTITADFYNNGSVLYNIGICMKIRMQTENTQCRRFENVRFDSKCIPYLDPNLFEVCFIFQTTRKVDFFSPYNILKWKERQKKTLAFGILHNLLLLFSLNSTI